MTTDRELLAWAAGFFDGEGNFSQYEYKSTTGRSMFYPRSAAVSTDRDLLEKFQRAVGVGQITAKTPSKLSKKPLWVWQSGSVASTIAVYAMLWEWLGIRRSSRIREIVLACRQQEKVSVAPYLRAADVATCSV